MTAKLKPCPHCSAPYNPRNPHAHASDLTIALTHVRNDLETFIDRYEAGREKGRKAVTQAICSIYGYVCVVLADTPPPAKPTRSPTKKR
jgi:hypothetical protein